MKPGGEPIVIAPGKEGFRIVKWEKVNVFGHLSIVVEYEKA